MRKSLKLEIEDLEERIAPGVVLTVGINHFGPGGHHDVVGPAQATGGAVTAFTAVSTMGPGNIANIDVDFSC